MLTVTISLAINATSLTGKYPVHYIYFSNTVLMNLYPFIILIVIYGRKKSK
jgi:hypothetical protein